VISKPGRKAVIVIPRRRGESIAIGDDIVVTVIEVRGDSVRVAIDRSTDSPQQTDENCEADQQHEAIRKLPR
jgi:carbon storage regulator